MAALYTFSSDLPVAMIGKVEPPLLRLPLELRQCIYAIILGPRRLIHLSDVRLELDPRSRAMIYRPKLEKLRERSVPENDEDIDDESHLDVVVETAAESPILDEDESHGISLLDQDLRVYVSGDKYGIPDLKKKAAQHFEKVLEMPT